MSISDTRYSVIVDGMVRRYYDTPDEALDFGRHAVYLASERLPDMEQLLRLGQIAEWSYGFTSVQVWPPQRRVDPALEGER